MFEFETKQMILLCYILTCFYNGLFLRLAPPKACCDLAGAGLTNDNGDDSGLEVDDAGGRGGVGEGNDSMLGVLDSLGEAWLCMLLLYPFLV